MTRFTISKDKNSSVLSEEKLFNVYSHLDLKNLKNSNKTSNY